MIDFIRGKVLYRTMDTIVVETGGIGYRIYCANPFQWEEDGEVRVFTHQVVREDALLLYGFSRAEERDLFRLLLEVSGIGPKVALSMIGGGSPATLVEAVQREDVKFLTRLPGIGKKTAQRLVLELKDKLEKTGFTRMWAGKEEPAPDSPSPASEPLREAIEGLKALGYNEEEAAWAVEEARRQFGEEEPRLDEWIRRALQVSIRR